MKLSTPKVLTDARTNIQDAYSLLSNGITKILASYLKNQG